MKQVVAVHIYVAYHRLFHFIHSYISYWKQILLIGQLILGNQIWPQDGLTYFPHLLGIILNKV